MIIVIIIVLPSTETCVQRTCKGHRICRTILWSIQEYSACLHFQRDSRGGNELININCAEHFVRNVRQGDRDEIFTEVRRRASPRRLTSWTIPDPRREEGRWNPPCRRLTKITGCYARHTAQGVPPSGLSLPKWPKHKGDQGAAANSS